MAKSLVLFMLLLFCKTHGFRVHNHASYFKPEGKEGVATQNGTTAPGFYTCSEDDEDHALPAQDPEQMNVFGEEYVIPTQGPPALLRIKAHDISWSGQSGDVLDYNDQEKVKFKIKGRASSVGHQKRIITDADGKNVYNIKEHFWQWNFNKQTIYASKANGSSGDELYQVYGNWADTVIKTTGMKNQKGQEVTFRMDIGFWGMKGVIRLGKEKTDPVIAKVCSPLQIKNFVLDNRDDFFLEIAPGVDMAAILSVMFSYDQMQKAWDD